MGRRAELVGQKKRRPSRPFLFFMRHASLSERLEQMKVTEQCFSVILLSMMQKAAPVLDSLGEILLCVQSNESN